MVSLPVTLTKAGGEEIKGDFCLKGAVKRNK
jgi:hypothetical protein